MEWPVTNKKKKKESNELQAMRERDGTAVKELRSPTCFLLLLPSLHTHTHWAHLSDCVWRLYGHFTYQRKTIIENKKSQPEIVSKRDTNGLLSSNGRSAICQSEK